MSDALNQVVGSGQQWAAARAQYALQVRQALEQGQIQPAEAKEILLDLINTEKLDAESADMQLRSALVFGVMEIVSFLG
jgi:phage tail tape-measure protein